MFKKALALLGIVAVVGVALGISGLLQPSAVDATQHSATRSFSADTVAVDTVAVGGELDVTIAISGHGGLASIVETLPVKFTYLRSSIPAATGPAIRSLTFTLFGAESEVTYTVMAPDATGSHTFSGVVKDSARDDESRWRLRQRNG